MNNGFQHFLFLVTIDELNLLCRNTSARSRYFFIWLNLVYFLSYTKDVGWRPLYFEIRPDMAYSFVKRLLTVLFGHDKLFDEIQQIGFALSYRNNFDIRLRNIEWGHPPRKLVGMDGGSFQQRDFQRVSFLSVESLVILFQNNVSYYCLLIFITAVCT